MGSALFPKLSTADKIFYFFDILTQKVNGVVKQNPHDFIDIETTEDASTISMNDGTLLTALCLEGCSKAALENEFAKTVDTLDMKLSSLMSTGSHYVSFYFSMDQEGVQKELEAQMEPSKLSLKRNGIDLDYMIDENIEALASHCHKERCFLLVWTSEKGLTVPERISISREKTNLRKGVPRGDNAQRFGVASPTLLTRHTTFAKRLVKDLRNVGLLGRVMKAKEFIREIRMSIEKEFTSYDWNPVLSNEPFSVRIDDSMRPDCSGMMPPRIQEQVIPRFTEEVGSDKYQVGSYLFAPMTISLQPKSPEPFWSLFRRVKQEGIPWHFHAMIKGNGMNILGLKEMLATFLQITPADTNKKIIGVRKRLAEFSRQGDIVQYQVSLATWGPSSDPNEVDTRRAKLVRAVQGWGNCEVAPAEGDPFETLVSSCPGLMKNNIGDPSAPPMYDALKMMPLTRPASHWETGSMMMRSEDGKVFNYQPVSPKQTSWITLIMGAMGSGKSMFMNYYNWCLILSSNTDELPFISIIDVGPSSSGLIRLIRMALPENKKHMAVYKKLSNHESCCINSFDTRPGLRFPLSDHRDFLITYLCYLMQEDGNDNLTDGVKGFATSLIDVAYKRFSERLTAKQYTPGIHAQIDSKVEKLYAEKGENTLWWDVVDYLFMNDDQYLSAIAQRHAVPTLPDLAVLCDDPSVVSMYEDTYVGNSPLASYARRKLLEAINTYPIISGITQFDLGEARIVSLDLDNVAKGEDPASKRRTGLMYMLSYYALTQRFYFDDKSLEEVPSKVGLWDFDYRPYHAGVVKLLQSCEKRFCIDEKHRIGGLKLVEGQMDTAILEARKFKIELVQASQYAHHFTKDSLIAATNRFILGGGSDDAMKEVAETFDLDITLRKHLYHTLTSPSKEGSTLIAMLEADKNTWNNHPLMVSIGSTFLWACNSSRDDSIVRNELYDRIGDRNTLTILKSMYPSGSISEEVEYRKDMEMQRLKKDSARGQNIAETKTNDGDELTPTSILSEIAQDIYEEFQFRRKKKQSKRFSESLVDKEELLTA